MGFPDARFSAAEMRAAGENEVRRSEFACPTRAELSRASVRAFLAAWDLVNDGTLPTAITKLSLDGTPFEITIDDLRRLVGDEFGPPL